MLKAEKIQFEYRTKTILNGITLNVNPGDRIGLIGPNGSGKTTLLRIMAGELTPTSGRVVNAGDLVGYMPQDPTDDLELSVCDFIKKLTGVLSAELEFEAVSGKMDESPESLQALESAMEKLEHLGAYTFETRLTKALKQVGLGESLQNKATNTLSGGQRKRVLLAAILMSQFDILLLDEPTNDLDLAGIALLERFIHNSKSAFVIVTHDRRMLRSVTTKIAELSSTGDSIELYSLGYEEYVQAREAKRRSIEEAYEQYQDEKKRLKEASKRLANESRKAEFNRNTSDNEKIAYNSAREKAATSYAASARAVSGRLEQLKEPPRPPKDLDLHFAFEGSKAQVSNRIVSLTQAVVDYPEQQIGPFNLDITRGERVVVIGPNGSGKTTLLKLIAGSLKASSGSVSFGKGVNVGLIDQHKSLPAPDETVVANMKLLSRKQGEAFDEGHARSILDRFNFDQDKVDQVGTSLSPGERARLLLAALVNRETNLLLLDEPTNHLDIPAMEELEKALLTYPETIVVVSHDREFIDSIKPTRTLEVIEGRLK